MEPPKEADRRDAGRSICWRRRHLPEPRGPQSVLYSFSGLQDGSIPLAGIVDGIGGVLYGSTEYGGAARAGVLRADASASAGRSMEPGGDLQLQRRGGRRLADRLHGANERRALRSYLLWGGGKRGNRVSTRAADVHHIREVTMSGVGLAGVAVSLSGDQSATATTDSTGAFSFSEPVGGNYTVTPALAGYEFSPASQSFPNLAANQAANFAALMATISGQVTHGGSGFAGATVSLSGSIIASVATDPLGNYSFTVPQGGSYTITPSIPGYSMTPANQTFPQLSSNATANFAAAPLVSYYTISGQVTLVGNGLPGVTMTLTGLATATTASDVSGNYSFTVAGGGSYTVTRRSPARASLPRARPLTAWA